MKTLPLSGKVFFSSDLSGNSSFLLGSGSSSFDSFDAGISFTITNVTGYRIDSMIIRNSADEKETILVSSKNPFEPWEERKFFFHLSEEEYRTMNELDESTQDNSYMMEVELENGTKYLLHDFPLGKSVKIMLIYEQNTGYVIYENIKNDKIISTLEIEKALSNSNYISAGDSYGEILDPYSDYYQNPYSDYDQPPMYIEKDYQETQNLDSNNGCLDGGLFW